MLDGFNRTVALKKQCAFSNSIKITQKIYFFLISSNYMNTGVTFNLSMEKIMRQIVEEVIMSDRHMLDGQIYSFLQLLLNSEKIKLN